MQKLTLAPALGLIMLAGGAIAGYAGLAFAQTDTSAAATATGTATPPALTQTMQPAAQTVDSHLGGHVGANGVREVLLTGDTAAKVTAAAEAAQPGATIDRVETDAEGAAYEAHMTKTDGSAVTLKFDTNYTVTATESGHGGPNGQ